MRRDVRDILFTGRSPILATLLVGVDQRTHFAKKSISARAGRVNPNADYKISMLFIDGRRQPA